MREYCGIRSIFYYVILTIIITTLVIYSLVASLSQPVNPSSTVLPAIEPSTTPTTESPNSPVAPTVYPPTTASSVLLDPTKPPYTSIAIPVTTASPQYLFVYGDSYTATGFNISGTGPTVGNPLGNPPYPGFTSTGLNRPNWLDILIKNSPPNTLAYNFAVSGAIVSDSAENPSEAYKTIPDFLNMSSTFITHLGSKPLYCPWTAPNSIHLVWFGRNDVFWQVVRNADMTSRLDTVIVEYVNVVDTLYQTGVRQFAVMGIPPMWLEPVWSKIQQLSSNGSLTITGPGLQVQTSSTYWNEKLQSSLTAWRSDKATVNVSFLDTWPAYHSVLDNYISWGLYSPNCALGDQGLPANATCPFADVVHPGPALATSVAIAAGQHLKSVGFLSAFGLRMT